jgi:hypothetical protein
MAFIPTRCPSCRRDIQVPDDVPRSSCMYCGSPIDLGQSRHASAPTLANYLGLARTALRAGNSSEAEQYFNRVLEIDPTISEAWVGKGKAAAWQSSLANIRLSEMEVAFSHAIATADDGEREAVVAICVHEMNELVAAVYGLARSHMLEFVAMDDAWATYLGRVSQLIAGLDSALSWDATSQVTLQNIVHLCKDNIEGVAYRDPFDNNLPKAWHLSPQYEAQLRAKLESASGRLRALDPTFSAPVLEKKKADTCFVVTATMGSPDHPHVVTLRSFRDQEIATRRLGRVFVDWYYKNGPMLASIIANRSMLRTASLILIVTPAAAVARLVQRRRARGAWDRARN